MLQTDTHVAASAAVSVVIPAFNEEHALAPQLREVERTLLATGWDFEIIVVDDGSTDGTREVAAAHQVHLIALPHNRGYGGALKAGIAASRHEWILITDADGSYPCEAIPQMLGFCRHHDMVVGARVQPKAAITLPRRVVKWFLRHLASYLAGKPIPDLNSGLRLIRRDRIERFAGILPSGFSFTTTITMALLANHYAVCFVPIDYRKRIGSSKMKARDTFRITMQILRAATMFQPLRLFLPLGAVPFAYGLAKLTYDLFQRNVTDSATMSILAGILVWSVGLLADQNARWHMAPKP